MQNYISYAEADELCDGLIRQFIGSNNITIPLNVDIDAFVKYSLQGTTQGNGLTGGLPPVRFSM